jgi:hypothetical protein
MRVEEEEEEKEYRKWIFCGECRIERNGEDEGAMSRADFQESRKQIYCREISISN